MFSLEINGKVAPSLLGVQSIFRLIRFFELSGTYIGVILWSPYSANNKDLGWGEIPVVADNLCNVYILMGNCTSGRPLLGFCKKWMSVIGQITSQ